MCTYNSYETEQNVQLQGFKTSLINNKPGYSQNWCITVEIRAAFKYKVSKKFGQQ